MKKSLEIRLDDEREGWFPAEALSGTIHWSAAERKSLELRLFWYTRGKGTRDVEVVKKKQYQPLETHGEKRFSFRLPLEPYSVSGRLISIVWALELIAKPGHDVERHEFVLSPTGREIKLPAAEVPDEESPWSFLRKNGRRR